MTQEEFAKELLTWKQEFTDEIIPYYAQGKSEHGEQAFGRWKERFANFLRKHVPREAERLITLRQGKLYAISSAESPYDVFMRIDGEACLAFIDLLIDDAHKGRITDFYEQASSPSNKPTIPITETHPYVNPTRIEELSNLSPANFDLKRLIRTCEELNLCYSTGCYLAIAILVRSILDHVPPIFNYKNFTEVVNNYKWSESHKKLIEHLEKSARPIADAHLHMQIRGKETLSNMTQVNFSNALDVLLGEIVRILK